MTYAVHEGDALEVLRTLPSNHYHGSLSDPPYGLSFMGHTWDHGVPSAEVWAEVLRCLKPGAHILAFGGTRTFHRLTCAIEDAGFEIRDCMQWIYGSGFPKSHDVSKAIDKANGDHRGKAGKVTSGNAAMGGPNYERTPKGDPIAAAAVQFAGQGTALKPAWEPIIVARKPLEGTIAQNVQVHGCGGLAIDASRVGIQGRAASSNAVGHPRQGGSDSDGVAVPSALGRWPANVILDEEAGQVLDAQTGHLHGAGYKTDGEHCKGTGKRQDLIPGLGAHAAHRHGDSGGASRFFKSCDYTDEDVARFTYCPKASRAERDAGLDGFDMVATSRYGEQGQGPTPKQTPRETVEQRNVHPTVKPLALNRYLARLLLPPIPDARMLTPFCGSGSEMIGAIQAGWAHVDGIDSWDVAARIARARLDHWSKK